VVGQTIVTSLETWLNDTIPTATSRQAAVRPTIITILAVAVITLFVALDDIIATLADDALTVGRTIVTVIRIIVIASLTGLDFTISAESGAESFRLNTDTDLITTLIPFGTRAVCIFLRDEFHTS